MKVVRCDVAVVGAGPAGTSLALFSAKKGFDVVVLELGSWSKVWGKPCGNGIGAHHFHNLGLEEPRGDELKLEIEGIRVYSPEEDAFIDVPGRGFIVDRVKLGQRLLKEAMDSGADVRFNHMVLDPIVEGGYVRGVVTYSSKSGETLRVESKVVADCSGVSRVVAGKMPKDWPVSEKLDLKDANIAYREVRKLKESVESKSWVRIYLNAEVAPGGYWWFFPMGENVVNVGLGVQGGVGHKPPKTYFDRWLLSRPELKGSELLEGGGAVVPTRDPLKSFVGKGLVVLGDAGYTVNPIHGGGIGSAMLAGKLAAEAFEEAYDRGKFDESGLWSLNVKFMRSYGAKQASLNLFRMFLQALSNEELQYGIKKKLIKGEDVDAVSREGELHLSVAEKALRLLSGISKPSLLFKLRFVARCMKEAKELYKSYPENVEGFKDWAKKVEELKTRFLEELKG